MNNVANIENLIRQEQMESFGRLIAGFSHDMKNHMGVIRESSGLINDFLPQGGAVTDENTVTRLKKSITIIEQRITTIAELLHHLSLLAHRTYNPLSTFQINDLLIEESFFLKRFSSLKQIEMVLDLKEGLPAIYNEGSLLQHVIYRLYIITLERIRNNGKLTICTDFQDEDVHIFFQGEKDNKDFTNQDISPGLYAALDKLNANLVTDMHKDNSDIFHLTVKPLQKNKTD